MGGVLIFFVALFLLLIQVWYLSFPSISCNVQSESNIGGFYEAIGGLYAQVDKSSQLSSITSKSPDTFSIISLRNNKALIINKNLQPAFVLFLSNGMWLIYDTNLKKNIYTNKPMDLSFYVDNPPPQGWIRSQNEDQVTLFGKYNDSHMMIEDSYEMEVTMCTGSIQSSPSVSPLQDTTNIQKLWNRPITTILLIIIFYIAYYLYANRVDVSMVSFSYSSVCVVGEYWRMVTASLSHFDLFHLGFNTMTLYQLGDLELVYGSLTYLYLSIALIFITMLICCAIYHVLIHRYNMVEMTYQEGVGYSCVLFAWMVALSVRLEKFCPIFIFPSFCLPTYFIEIPYTKNIIHLPVNFGPLILLVLTKIIIPRSSFIGHLSGIIIGYPLAWNMLNWLTPPILIVFLTCLLIYKSQLYSWKLPGYEINNNNLDDFVPTDHLRTYKVLFICLYVFCLSVFGSIYFQSYPQYLSRILLIFLLWNTLQARRCEFYLNDSPISNSTQNEIAMMVVVTFFYTVYVLVYDSCNFVSTLAAINMLVGSGSMTFILFFTNS